MSETKKPPHQLSQISEEPKKQKKKPKNKNSSSSSESQNSKDQKVQKKNQILLKDLIAENFVTLTMIGKGAFGQIYLSYDMRDNIEVAIKKELKRAQKQPQLKTEAKIYQSLLNINSQEINKEQKEDNEIKENKELKGNNEKKEERISKENKDLLLRIINDTIKKRLEELEKRNIAENNSINILNTNTLKIKSIYILLIYNII